MSDLILAKDKLLKGEYSCVIVQDGEVCYTSFEKGVRPLLIWLEENTNGMQGMTLADKVIGKAAALLALHGGVQEVYAHVIGDCAKIILEKNGIKVDYNRMVPYIMNRDGTDKCPLEKVVDTLEDPQEAFHAINGFIKSKAGA